MKAKGIIIPTITLVIIALVTSVLLVVTNDATKDKIALLQEESNRAARQEVLPNADDFEESAINIDGTDYIYWKANNDAGYVFSTQFKGYGGPVVVMTGISSGGKVMGVKITEQNETPGLGQKALDASFTDQYIADLPENGFEVTKQGAAADNEIDALAGATITSRAVTNSVNLAIDIYKELTGGAN